MVALLGFGLNCSENNLKIARKVGLFLGKHKCEIVSGGSQGTFEEAYNANRENQGKNTLFIEKNRDIFNPELLDRIEYFESTEQKHKQIVNSVELAIAIGGGIGTLNLVTKMLEVNKPVLVVKNTEGISNDPPNGVILIEESEIEKELIKYL